MTRYIDADKAVEEARLAYCKDCKSYNGVMCRACAFDDAMSYIDDFPAADVVPKSEVDKWQERCREWHEVAELKSQRIVELEAELSKSKTDVAREIFERLHAHRKYDGHTVSVLLNDLVRIAKEYGVDLP